MFSCWHDLLFLFCLLVFYLFRPSMGWLCGVGVFGLIVFSLSPGLAQRTPINNINNKLSELLSIIFGNGLDKIILCGDFNLDILNYDNNENTLNLLNSLSS